MSRLARALLLPLPTLALVQLRGNRTWQEDLGGADFFFGDKRINQGEPTNMVIESVQLLVVASRNGFSGHKLKAPNPGLVKSIPLYKGTQHMTFRGT